VVALEITGGVVPRLSRAAMKRFLRESLRHLENARAVREPLEELSIAFVSDSRMKALNLRFRKRNQTTDVLTFPGESAEIVISLPTAKRQAREERHSLATEVRYLLLHGLIHSLGYDHATDEGEMDALEMRLRAKVGLA